MAHSVTLRELGCMECGTRFIGKDWGSQVQRTCSAVCLEKVRARVIHALPRRGPENNRWKGGKPEWTCERCGEVFSAYETDRGGRKFCSWRCSNLAHGKKVCIMIRARLRFENKLFHRLESEGWRCLRSAGSRGAFDLVAFSENAIRLIQIKTTKDLSGHSVEHMLREACALLLALKVPDNVERWLYVKVMRGDWYSEKIGGEMAGDLRASVKGMVHRWREVKP